MRPSQLISSMLLLFCATAAAANCVSVRCNDVYVERLFVRANGLISVGTSGTETGLSCTPFNTDYLTLDPQGANADAIYSAILAAQLADKRVTFRMDDGSPNCTIQYIWLDRQ